MCYVCFFSSLSSSVDCLPYRLRFTFQKLKWVEKWEWKRRKKERARTRSTRYFQLNENKQQQRLIRKWILRIPRDADCSVWRRWSTLKRKWNAIDFQVEHLTGKMLLFARVVILLVIFVSVSPSSTSARHVSFLHSVESYNERIFHQTSWRDSMCVWVFFLSYNLLIIRIFNSNSESHRCF